MKLIVIEFWWAYWFDLLPILEGEDLYRYVLGWRRPRSEPGPLVLTPRPRLSVPGEDWISWVDIVFGSIIGEERRGEKGVRSNQTTSDTHEVLASNPR